jgi:hypothetical protein
MILDLINTKNAKFMATNGCCLTGIEGLEWDSSIGEIRIKDIH